MSYRTILLFGPPGSGKGTQGRILGSRKWDRSNIASRAVIGPVPFFRLFYKRIDSHAYRLLKGLDRGATLGKAIKSAFSDPPDAELIRKWFKTWTELGWFCKREREGPGAVG